MILIVSTYRDFHAFAVQWALRRMGVECKILDLFRVVAGGSVTLDVVRGHLEWTCPRTESVESVSLHDIDCVWMRRGNREFDVSRVHNLDREVVQREVISLARGIEAWVGRSVPAINSPYSLGVADQKLVQLTEAAGKDSIIHLHVQTTPWCPCSRRDLRARSSADDAQSQRVRYAWQK